MTRREKGALKFGISYNSGLSVVILSAQTFSAPPAAVYLGALGFVIVFFALCWLIHLMETFYE